MPDLYLIFNHKITRLQENDARRSLGVERIVDLPLDLKEIWCNMPPELVEISKHLESVKQWLASKAKANDFVLIQGDFGACFLMVNFALERGLVPVYSTTKREATEEYGEDGSIRMTHRFEHQMFRRYEIFPGEGG